MKLKSCGIFIKDRQTAASGSSLIMTIEGNLLILLEVQALTNTTVFGYPVRKSSGFDVNRLQLLTAVLQKHLKANLGNQDIYVNVVSGYRLNDPAADLGVCLAILSSYFKNLCRAIWSLLAKSVFPLKSARQKNSQNSKEIENWD